MWWLRRSISTTSASARRSARAAATPAKPPPTITTRGRAAVAVAVASSGLISAVTAFMDISLKMVEVTRPGRRPAPARAAGRQGRRPDYSSLLSGNRRRIRGLLSLGAQFQEAQQDLVALRLQLFDRAGADLLVDAVDELLLGLRRQHRIAERLPPDRQWAGELLEEVLDSAGPAAQVVEHHIAHDSPPEARTPGKGGVDAGGADDALGHQVIDLTREGGLQPVGDVARHLLQDPHGLAADRGVEFVGAPDRL